MLNTNLLYYEFNPFCIFIETFVKSNSKVINVLNNCF